MKKNIVIPIILNIFLLLSMIMLILALIFVTNLHYLFDEVGKYQVYTHIPNMDNAKLYEHLLENLTFPIAVLSISLAINFIAIILVDLPFIKKLFLIIKNRCSTAKSQRAEAKKQARIAQLQADLEELKKD